MHTIYIRTSTASQCARTIDHYIKEGILASVVVPEAKAFSARLWDTIEKSESTAIVLRLTDEEFKFFSPFWRLGKKTPTISQTKR